MKLVTVKYPNDISGMEAWYDAKDFNSTADSTEVTTWNDKSGNGHHLVQSTAGKKPIVKSLNGNKFLDSNNENRYFQLAFTRVRPLTIFCVYKVNTIASNIYVTDGYTDQGSTAITTSGGSGGTGLQYGMTSGNLAFGVSTNTIFAQVSVQQVDTAAASFGRYNGVQKFTGTSDKNIGGITLFARADLASARFADASIAEYISYNRALTLTEIQQIERYLKFKWGL